SKDEPLHRGRRRGSGPRRRLSRRARHPEGLRKPAHPIRPILRAAEGHDPVRPERPGRTAGPRRPRAEDRDPGRPPGAGAGGRAPAPADGGPVAVERRDVLGERKKNPMVAFYAAGIGVMFLLFSAAGAGGALIEEAESGTLDRILATRVSMTKLLLGKLTYLAG